MNTELSSAEQCLIALNLEFPHLIAALWEAQWALLFPNYNIYGSLIVIRNLKYRDVRCSLEFTSLTSCKSRNKIIFLFLINQTQGWGFNSVVEYKRSVCKATGSIPIAHTKKAITYFKSNFKMTKTQNECNERHVCFKYIHKLFNKIMRF